MIKIQQSTNITPFGGIHLVHKQLIAHQIPNFINKQLGARSEQAQYSYADMLLSLLYISCCGGSAMEDIQTLRPTLSNLSQYKPPSADTLLNMQKELVTPAEEKLSADGVTKNKININERLNKFLLQTALYTKQLKTTTDYCLDFDHQHIVTDKYDATLSYKMTNGYFPAVASINNLPVYIENRNGNCSVKFEQLDTLKRVFDNLWSQDIKPKRCRMDSGSYIKEVTNYLAKEDVLFYIRANQSQTLKMEAAALTDWKQATIGLQTYEVNSLDYTFGNKTHRMVVYRKPNRSGNRDLFTGDAKDYLYIITNDRDWDEQTIISFYNQRAASEQLFDIQNNDFNWNHLPFSFLEHNTVYLILTAVVHVLYRWFIAILSQTYTFLSPTDRMKKFRFRLINIVGKVIRSARRTITKLLVPPGHFLAKAFP